MIRWQGTALSISPGKSRLITPASRRNRGMSLIEIVIASLIIGAAFLLTLGVLSYTRVESAKARDRGIMLDFMHHYLEVARAGPYDNVAPNRPINALYDGTRQILLPNGTRTTVNISFPPSDGQWRSLYTSAFLIFHPDLEWLKNRNPEYRVTISTQMVGGTARAKLIRLETRWRPPLGIGRQVQTLDMDTVIYPEFN